jgi:hypothetical protein
MFECSYLRTIYWFSIGISFLQLHSPIELAQQLTIYLKEKFQALKDDDLFSVSSIGESINKTSYDLLIRQAMTYFIR